MKDDFRSEDEKPASLSPRGERAPYGDSSVGGHFQNQNSEVNAQHASRKSEFHAATKTNVGALHPLTKREIGTRFRERLETIIAEADRIPEDSDYSKNLEAAVTIAKQGRQMLAEIDSLFAERVEA